MNRTDGQKYVRTAAGAGPGERVRSSHMHIRTTTLLRELTGAALKAGAVVLALTVLYPALAGAVARLAATAHFPL